MSMEGLGSEALLFEASTWSLKAHTVRTIHPAVPDAARRVVVWDLFNPVMSHVQHFGGVQVPPFFA